jgi:molybdate transport system substrate-binding protein
MYKFIKKEGRVIMKKKFLSLIVMVVLTASMITGCSSSKAEEVVESETDIYVFIAASLTNVMEEIQSMYAEVAPKVTILYNAHSSGTLEKQIKEGARCDVFFSAATKQMDGLDEAGFVVEGTINNLLMNQVVLIKATGAETLVTSFEDITKASNLALAGESVPAGAYAREIFENIGNIEDVLTMEINEGDTVTAVLAAVSEKSNEVGIVYATDAASMSDAVEIIAVAPEGSLKKPVIYPVGQIVNSEATQEQLDATADFLAFLSTEAALEVFQSYGFSIYSE